MRNNGPFYQPWVACFLLAGLLVSCDRVPRTVTIDNTVPRRDVSGHIIDAHDGCLQFFNGRFYLYGTAYGTNDGFNGNNHFQVYSSPDLGRWTLEGDIIKLPPTAIYFRPYVVFNPHTKKYVLWFNWYPLPMNFRLGRESVAVSDSPTGPFTLVTTNLHIPHSDSHPGDGSLFVDNDGTGYYIYTLVNYDFNVQVARLTSDYLGLTGEVSDYLHRGAEAPVLFRRKNIYYGLCSSLGNFDSQGSEVQILTATSPLGPYHLGPYINSKAQYGSPFIAAQETWVAQLPAAGEPMFIWMADRWGSTPDGAKGHDFQFWSAPLNFSDTGDILPIERVGSYQINW